MKKIISKCLGAFACFYSKEAFLQVQHYAVKLRGSKKSVLLVAFLLLFGFSASAQSSIHGKISDEKGNPIPGATVQVKGMNKSVSTDQQGNFTLSVPSASSILVVSFIGYESKDIAVLNQRSINVTLVPAFVNMGEVVVVGYGTQKKSDLTGAISSVSAKDLEKATPINATEALQGRAAGVMVTSNSGAPGSEGTIRIRGIGTVNNNDPVYIVDGMFVSGINFLNPSDISRMEVLKDASATAIYGSRGANGVILVTTHKGSRGKPVIVFNANTAISKVSDLTKTLNRDQYLDYMKTTYYNGYMRSVPDADPSVNPFTTTLPFFNQVKTVKQEYDKGHNTNWGDELFKTSLVQNYDLAIRGGAQNVRYALSAGYFNQDGLIDNSSYKRYTFRLNTDYTVSKRIVVGQNLGVTSSKTLGFATLDGPKGPVAAILNSDPLTPVVKPNADLSDPDYRFNKFASSDLSGEDNPAGIISRNHNTINLLQLVGNVYGELALIEGLKLKSSIGYDYSDIHQNDFLPKYFISGRQSSPVSTVINNRNNTFGLVWENTLNYNTILADDHSISGLLGYTEELYTGQFANASRQNTPNNDPSMQVISAATGALVMIGNKTQTSLRSFFARLNYTFSDRYLLTASIRRDGSSKFAEGKKWGVFPSVSAGWRINNEQFFENLNASFISNLKLRAGWGQIGNQSMPGGNNNPYLSLIQGTDDFRYVFGNQAAIGNYLVGMGTPGISWETSEQTNIGLDMGLFKNRLTVSADFFVKNTKNMLLQVQTPSYAGFPTIPYTNAGEVQNSGFELVSGYEGKAGAFSYGVSANVSKFINKAVSLGGGNRPIVYSDNFADVNRTEVGRSIGAFYGWATDGIFQNIAEVQAFNKNGQLIQPTALPGDFRFKDINSDGVIDAKDKTWIGNPLPKLTYGFNLTMAYKNFDLSAFLQGSYGNDLYNLNKIYRNKLNGQWNGTEDAFNAAWRGEGTSNSQPIMSTVDRNNNFRTSDFYVEDGSYLRLKNLQIGYAIPSGWASKMGINKSRIWVGGTDLFTITDYTGNDPEAGLTASPIQAGREFSPYPKMKRFSAGINLTL